MSAVTRAIPVVGIALLKRAPSRRKPATPAVRSFIENAKRVGTQSLTLPKCL
jgi:hypothetical protein